MKHKFQVIEEQEITLANAVGAYLDCEHYVFLHGGIMPEMFAEKLEGRRITYRQGLRWGFLRSAHIFTTEYFPPGHFRTFDLKSSPKWMPSLHHVVKMVIDVRYTKHPERDTTLMQFDVELDMPFWLWPFRRILQGIMERMHYKKDQEDIEMIQRRAKIFGPHNISSYLAEGQFLLFKDDYVRHFGASARHSTDSPATSAARLL
ncbi:MAG: hypothetical protein HY074_18485 [Deltaproteobacteria bacterium]|nr:hypothetical protein [Deltaproteobacteria bacterium]